MPSDPFPFPNSESRTVLELDPRCYWKSFFQSNGTLKIRLFPTAFLLSGLMVYLMVFPPQTSQRFPVWYLILKIDTFSLEFPEHYEPIVDPNLNLDTFLLNPTPKSTISDDSPPPLPSSSPLSDVLTIEQIRDIVAPTRGFFSRDYDMGLGWNSISVSLSTEYQL